MAYTRLLYRVESHESTWLVRDLTAIYERDTLAPTVPGQTVTLDPELLAGTRSSYRYLSYLTRLRSGTPRDDLYGDDQPGPVEQLYASAFEWMRAQGAHDE